MSNYRQYRALEASGIDLVELLGGDRPLESEEFREVVNRVQSAGDDLHTDLLYLLTYRRFEPDEAQRLWRGILKHKRRLARQLGRDPGVRMSALDYLANVRGILSSPRLVDREDFAEVLDSLHTDDLTGLLNRRHMTVAYQAELLRARRYGKALTLMTVDIDGFKEINDTFGHAAGDEVLVAVGKLLSEVCRETDVVGRWGGDEFLVLLPETGKDDAYHLAERIRHTASTRELSTGAGRARATLSIGLATYPGDSQDAAELLKLADRALYASKQRGRDAVTGHDPAARDRDQDHDQDHAEGNAS